jgi:hypothetical protein
MGALYGPQFPLIGASPPMIRRRPLLGATALCAALTLAACTTSPEAGRPATTPPSSSTPAASTPSTPTWTQEELAAITGAKARYMAARAAINTAMQDPRKSTRAQLEKAGNGGNWISAILAEVDFQRQRGWYQDGSVQIASTSVDAVKLSGEQPEVRLTACIDSSKISTKYQANGKPVPMGPNDGNRQKAQARLVFAPPLGKTTKMWFLVEEKGTGKC